MALDYLGEICLPYCIKFLDDGQIMVLNREYKPLGFKTRQRVNYGDYPIAVRLSSAALDELKALSIDGGFQDNEIVLYDDNSNPSYSSNDMKVYLEKLAKLMVLKVL